MDTRGRGKSKTSAMRTRRERQAQARCSASSADEDQIESLATPTAAPGSSYSSDETLKAYECEVKSALKNGRAHPEEDTLSTATDCLTDVTPAEDTDRDNGYGYHDNRGSYFSYASEGDVESEGEGISSEQLLKVVDNYLKNKPWDTHSNSTVHSLSSRSSLTLTETEHEGRDSSDQQETATTPVNGSALSNTSTLPSTSKTLNCSIPIRPATVSSRSSAGTSSLPRFDPPPPPLPERNPSLYNTSVISEVEQAAASLPPILPPPAPVLGASAPSPPTPPTPQALPDTPTDTMGLPQTEQRPYQSIQSLQGGRSSMQKEDRHHFDYPNAMATTVQLPPFTRALHNDFRPSAKVQLAKQQKKKETTLGKVCHWKCLAVLFMFVTLILATAVAYFIAMRALDVNWRMKDQPGQLESDSGRPDSTSNSLDTKNPLHTVFPTKSPTRPPSFVIGQTVKTTIPPKEFSRTLLYVLAAKFVEFNISVPKDSHLVLYARKDSAPSHSNFDYIQVFRNDDSTEQTDSDVDHGRRTRSQGLSYSAHPDRLPVQVDTNELQGVYKRDLRYSSDKSHSDMDMQGKEETRERRSVMATKYETFVEYMLAGQWHIGIYNDGLFPEKISMTTTTHQGPDEPDTNCGNKDCSKNHGRCINGSCVCYPAYTGDDCSITVCPVICSGHGFYESGSCQCDNGWKGFECDTPDNECISANCSNHGTCYDGKCMCQRGFQGESCELVDCMEPSCSSHGICVDGVCHCNQGWRGETCSQDIPAPSPENNGIICPSVAMPTAEETDGREDGEERPEQPTVQRCSGHGYYDTIAAVCVCHGDWGGKDCSQAVCYSDSDCVHHEECRMNRCVCQEGWTGDDCMTPYCQPSCDPDHGACVEGECKCQPGWNGKQCTIEACPNACNGHGECSWIDNKWGCFCRHLWRGEGCQVGVEDRCNDRRDNDQDGLTDCEDPDCCTSIQCISGGLCRSVTSPVYLIQQRGAVSPMAPFFEHVRFLTDEVQLNPMPIVFADGLHKISVVRGKVMTHDGSPLIGVAVRIQYLPLFGSTLTRRDGMFDILVKGGGSVSLQFSRGPFQPVTKSIFVPWNEFVVMDDITMVTHEVRESYCDVQLFPRPAVVFLTMPSGDKGSCGDCILADTQAVHEEVPIPGTSISFVYYSNKVAGYKSLLHLQLTPPQQIENLKKVHIKVTVKGQIFTESLEAGPDLQYIYAWDKLNAYGEKVYGTALATVSVGYEYKDCNTIVWDRKTAKLRGHDMTTTDLAGWRINVHHGYNVKQGTVHKGDGTDIRVPEEIPPIINTVLGNGKRRNMDCPQCDGKARSSKLLAPVAVASSPDGSVFVGDYNFIRKIQPDGNVSSILHLHYLPNVKYYLAVSPLDGSVYMSDSQTRQILKLPYTLSPSDITNNKQLVAGTGSQCLPLDSNNCGDGGQAREAKLLGPKGLTVSQDGTIYFVDGFVIRQITVDGIISTYLGDHGIIDRQIPLKCDETMTFDDVKLEWPVDIAINPIDQSLYVLDNNIVLKLTPDKHVTIVAGQPVHCISTPSKESTVSTDDSAEAKSIFRESTDFPARDTNLINARSIAFSSSGELYITESKTSDGIHQVRKVTVDGRLVHVAGQTSDCDCNEDDCSCYNGDDMLAEDAMLSLPISVTVGPDDTVYVADQGNIRIRAIKASTPESRNHGKQYFIESAVQHEVYVFNYRGKHIMTNEAVTNETVFSFIYTDDNEVKQVIDSSSRILKINRDADGYRTTIMTPNNEEYDVIINSNGLLQSVRSASGNIIASFTYHGNSALLATRADEGILTAVYWYDAYGRVISIAKPNADQLTLKSKVDIFAATTKLLPNNQAKVLVVSEVNSEITQMQEILAEKRMNITVAKDNTVLIKFANAVELELESGVFPTMKESSKVLTKRKISLPSGNVHRYEWRFYVRRGGTKQQRTIQVVGRRLRINGVNVLTLEYNRFTRLETFQNADNSPQLFIEHNSNGLPTEWVPLHENQLMKSVHVDYNYEGRVLSWKRGSLFENTEYDNQGRVVSKHFSDGSVWRFSYTNHRQPTTVIFPAGQEYHLGYESGHLSTITTPTKTTYNMERLGSIGYYRNIYFINGTQWLIQDYLSNGVALSTFYPASRKRVTRIADNQGRLSEVFFDKTSIKYDFYRIEGQLKSIEVKDGSLKSALRYKYHGPLVKEQTMRINEDGYIGVEYRYTHNNNFHVASIQADFDGHSLPLCNYTYHEEMLYPLQYCNYTVIQMEWYAVVMTKGDLKLTKQFDPYGRLIIYQLDIDNIVVFKMNLKYNNVSLVSEREMRTLDNEVTIKFDYDSNGQIIEAVAVNWLSWKYYYDNNGNLATVKYNGKDYIVRHDGGDRIKQYDQHVYKIGDDGFLLQRGMEIFDYGSNGQLTRVVKRGSYETWYHYDGKGRRIVQGNSEGSQIQYFYGHTEHPWRVTHIYDKESQEIWSLTYDLEGFLMAITIGSRQFYITTDQVGSPVAVFNSRRALVKQIVYSPHGDIVHDGEPNFKLHIGFRGGIYDHLTKLVHFKQGDYDPAIGQWITPQLDMWVFAAQTNRHPILNMYAFNGNNPVNEQIGQFNYMMEVTDWLPVLRYDIKTMVPNLNCDGGIVREDLKSYRYSDNCLSNEVLSTVQSEVTNLADSFNSQFFTLPTKQILKSSLMSQSSLLPTNIGSTIFGDSAVLYVINKQVVTQLLNPYNNQVAKIAKVLNGSEILDRLHYTHNGKDTHYFVKERKAMSGDLSLVGSSGGLQLKEEIVLNEELSVTIHTIYPGHMNQLATIDIKIHSKYSVLNIRYGSSVLDERMRVIRHKKLTAITQAWNDERSVILDGRPGSRQWTDEERASLIENTHVNEYDGYFFHDVDSYPELADDSNCIQLLTYDEGAQLASQQMMGQK
ncbi:teneurin-3-like [Glandiceps talaboti]